MHRPTLVQMLVPALAALAGAAAGAPAFGAAGAALFAAAGAALGVWLAPAAETARPRRESTAAVDTDDRLPAGYGRFLLEKLPVGVLLIDRRGRV
ncbi:MAG TPA: hypothetical protein VMM55_11335, partial [Thermohalobaculum sp.]|nr:hypothetical protein [Thermohalobaculum sp.]